MRVGNDDRIRRRVRRVMSNGFNPGRALQMQAQRFGREVRVKFAGVIQNRHRKKLKFYKYFRLSLPYHLAKPWGTTSSLCKCGRTPWLGAGPQVSAVVNSNS